VRIIECDNKTFEHEDESWTVASFEVIDGQLVRLLGPGVEMSVVSDTRGEGMVTIANLLKSLGYKMSRLAFEQEGAIDLSTKKERK
jgi:hypothetical protein